MTFNWNQTLDFLERRASFSPDWPVLYESDRNREYSYLELNQRASALAAYLTGKANLQKGDRMAVLARNCVEYIDFFFAALKTGIILVPLNVRLSAAELSDMLRQTKPRLLAYEEAFEEISSALENSTIEKLVVLKKERSQLALKAENYDAILETNSGRSSSPVDIQPEDPLLLLFTGGTTGPPKAAVISHRAVFFNMLSETISWQLGPKTVVPGLLPFFHTGGWNLVTLPTMFAGGQVLINPTFDPELTLKQIEEKKCSFLFAAATMFRMISAQDSFEKTDLSSLQFVMSGAAPCPVSVMEPYWEKEIKFVQGYGITEGGPNNLYMPWYSLSWKEVKEKCQSVGKPFIYCQARIVDENGEEKKPGQLGELILGGPVTFSGYWNNPDETKNTLRHGWVYTGDIARKDEDGFYYIADRKKDMYISGGENVFPVEVEKIIEAHPQVQEAAVIGVPDEKWGETGKAFVVLKPGESIVPEDIKKYLGDKLARYKLPREVILVDGIPKSSVGKVLKKMLSEDN